VTDRTQQTLEAATAAAIVPLIPAWLNGAQVDVALLVERVAAAILPTLQADGSALVTSVGLTQTASVNAGTSSELAAGLTSILGPAASAEAAAARREIILAPAGSKRRRQAEIETVALQSWAGIIAVQVATFALSLTRETMLGAALAAIVATSSAHVERTWQTRHDAKVRPAHAEVDGEHSPLGGTFSVGGAQMRYPGDPTAPLALTINCRCHLSYALKRQPVTKGAAA
jgi:hypothetical protein